MVFQRPNPFPNFSIFKNVLAGYILNDIKLSKEEKNHIVQEALYAAAATDTSSARNRLKEETIKNSLKQYIKS